MSKTNYNKMSKKPNNEVKVETGSLEVEQTTVEVEETPVENELTPDVTEMPEIKKGVVVNCSALNVRKAPEATAEIIGVLSAKTEVSIVNDFGDFYEIEPGEHYCMKKYISIK